MPPVRIILILFAFISTPALAGKYSYPVPQLADIADFQSCKAEVDRYNADYFEPEEGDDFFRLLNFTSFYSAIAGIDNNRVPSSSQQCINGVCTVTYHLSGACALVGTPFWQSAIAPKIAEEATLLNSGGQSLPRTSYLIKCDEGYGFPNDNFKSCELLAQQY